MKTSLVRIGNSRGVRIPKALIKECGLDDEVELTVKDKTIVLSPVRSAREGWDAAFRDMAARGDDSALLDEAAPTEFDRTEWQW